MPNYPKARKKALDETRHHSKVFAEKFKRGVVKRQLSPRKEEQLKETVFGKNLYSHPTLANCKAVATVSEILIDELLLQYHQTKYDRSMRYFVGTLCFDDGIIDCDHFLDTDVDKIISKTRKAMSRVGLSGICMVQADILRKTKDYPRHRILTHVHTVCWTTDPNFQPVVAGRLLSGSKAMPNSFGAPSAKFVSRRQSASGWNEKKSGRKPAFYRNLHRDQNAASIAHLGFYMASQPSYAKVIVPADRPGRNDYMRSTDQKYTPDMAVAIGEHLNEIPVLKSIFGVAEGTAISRAVHKRFRLACK